MATLDITKHAYNETALRGRWIELSRGGEILIARWNNPEFRKLQTKLYQDYRKPGQGPRIKGNHIPGAVQEKISFELVVKTIVLDWRDISSGTDAFPCTDENKRFLLGNEQYRWIFDEITGAAMDDDAYLQELAEEDQGNSEAA